MFWSNNHHQGATIVHQLDKIKDLITSRCTVNYKN